MVAILVFSQTLVRSVKFGNGEVAIRNISFDTFRYWKATMEYHRTKDILHVMRVLGHKKIENTLIYTQLVDFEDEDDFHSATARTVKEAKEFVKAGFSYVCDIEGVKLFRKRK